MTIDELLTEAARPVLDAVPERASTWDLYAPFATDDDVERIRYPLSRPGDTADPAALIAEVEEHNAWMAQLRDSPFVEGGDLTEDAMRAFALMLRGPIRMVLTGVHSGLDGPLDVRVYADTEAGVLWSWRPDTTQVGGWGFTELRVLFDRVVGFVPEQRRGRFGSLMLRAGARGELTGRDAERAALVREFLRRPRTGTTVVDLMAFDRRCAQFPRLGYVVVDNDLGRHVLATVTEPGEGAQLFLVSSDRDRLAQWMTEAVEAAMTCA
jgi:hypothetical protein